jgi:trimeric autotransporter adhesin
MFSSAAFQGKMVLAAGSSFPLTSKDVTITNNVGKADTISVTGVTNGDVITIYNTLGKVLATKKVASSQAATIISMAQLGVAAGTIYMTVTSPGMSESSWTTINFPAEGVSEDPLADNVTITNNAGKADTIYVCGLAPGDKVNFYTAAIGGKLLGTATVGGINTDVTKSISQLGVDDGSIYISVTSKGMHESNRVEVDFSGENKTQAIKADNVTITNNSGKADTVYICGLAPKDKINIYNKSSGGNPIATKTVASTSTDATISLSQLSTDSGDIYISNTSSGMQESNRTMISYSGESNTSSISKGNVTITNNSGTSDVINVTGVASNATVYVYDESSGGNLLGSATAASDGSATIKVSQLGTEAGTVYISVKTSGSLESSRTAIDYSAEAQTSSLSTENIIATNNSGKADTVYVSGLSAGQKINVYDSASGGNLLGSATVASSATDATVTISQLGKSAGSVYVSVTDVDTNKKESSRVEADYSAEEQSDVLSTDDIVVTNSPTGTKDTVYVSDLNPGDVIKVYDSASGSTVLGSATVTDDGTDATISITQLGKSAGSVYVSRTENGKSEGSRVKADYSAESQTNTLDASKIVVNNNVGADDTIDVSGVSANQEVCVYDAAKGGNLLGSAAVASGSTSATITVSQLSSAAGNVYVSVKDTNKLESDRVQVSYSAEEETSSLDANNVIITNNASGTSDTVYVSGLTEGDKVNVYDSTSGGTLLGSGTVASGSEDVTISITQLGTAAGSAYVSLTKKDKSESSRVKIDYSAESQTNALDSSNIVVTNNVGANDTVQVSGVSSNQVIKVYDAAKGGNLLGSATVAAGSTSGTVSISQLGFGAGSVYVSLTDTNKRESDRVAATYSAESTSDALSASNISVTNRSGSADTVSITGASQNDVINVYDLAKGGTLLGSATVASGATKATISIDQLGTDVGSIYVSRTSSNKSESSRVKVDYDAEPESTAPSASNIIVTNNAGIADTVGVKGLSVGDEVQVYDSASGGTVLGSATVASGSTEATVSISQLGTDSGNIYVSTTSTNKSESNRTQVSYAAEAQSTAPDVDKITITNNAGTAGTVKVTGLTNGDIVKVYDSANSSNLLGSATVGTYDTSATVSVTQLGESAGYGYVTVTSTGKTESSRTQAAYSAKTVSTAPSASSITVTNNSGLGDTIDVTGLQPNDVINVYDASTGGNLLGTITVGSSAYKGTVGIAQLGTNGGTVYVSITSTGKTESSRTAVDYSAESQSDPLDSGDVTIKNNAGTADTIDVTGVSKGDVINVYSGATGGTAIGTATVGSGESEAIVSISQLGTSAGTAYISVTRSGKTESSRTAVTYTAESTAPVEGNISIINNADIADTITVKGLTSNEVIKVYDAATGGNLIGQASVGSNSDTAQVTVSQLTEAAGSVYISGTEFGKGESKRTKADYIAEQTSAALYSGNVAIKNNPSGIADTITVSNLAASDIVKVYDASTGGNLIGTATVSSNGTTVTITISQLSAAAGNVYMTVTNVGKKESSRIQVGYTSEN